MFSVIIIFFMKGGFMLFESGLVRAKNTINTAQKNLTDTFVATLVFYLGGYGIMFGATQGGWFGWNPSPEFHETNHFFFLYQVAFCTMAATAVSGALAERIRFESYIFSTIFVTMIVYPVFGHWAWGNKVLPDNISFLSNKGFIDFAGSTVVMAVGGWCALAGIIVLGPRRGRFSADGKVMPMPANNVVLAALGAIILWVGQIAFNAGLAKAGSLDTAHIMSNTLLGGATSGLTSLIFGRMVDGLFRPERCIYGLLGGVVAVAAGCPIYAFSDMMILGVTTGIMVLVSYRVLTNVLKLDDVTCAIPINAICGSWGTLMVAVLGKAEHFGGNTRLEQLSVQAQGVGLAFLWAFTAAYIFYTILNKIQPLRVSEEDEQIGLNSAEHGVTIGTGLLQEALKDMVGGSGDLTVRLDETTGDESAEIAYLFNRFTEKLQVLMINIEQNSKIITSSSDNLRVVANEFAQEFDKITGQSSEVSNSTTKIAHDLDAISNVIRDVNQNVGHIVNNAEDVSSTIESVSKEVSGMERAIGEIAHNSSSASTVAAKAEVMIHDAKASMDSLNRTATSIDSILKQIQSIAGQTNMLALNASIEAASAGDAGKGFEVVAGEVKALADETAKAAAGISSKITEIQGQAVTTGAIVSELNDIISTINQSISSISSATETQRQSTGTISRNLGQTVMSAKAIAKEIGSIAHGTEEASGNVRDAAAESGGVIATVKEFTTDAKANAKSAAQVKQAVNDLSAVSGQLTTMINQYKIK